MRVDRRRAGDRHEPRHRPPEAGHARSGRLGRADASGAYRLTLHASRVGNAALSHASLGERVMPFLQSLVAETGETASLAVIDGDTCSIVQRVESHGVLRAELRVGALLDLEHSASGRVLAAFADPATLQRLRAGGMKLADEALLARVRKERFAPSSGRSFQGVRAVAVPIFAAGGGCLAALSLVGPLPRFTIEKMRERRSAAAPSRSTPSSAGQSLMTRCGHRQRPSRHRRHPGLGADAAGAAGRAAALAGQRLARLLARALRERWRITRPSLRDRRAGAGPRAVPHRDRRTGSSTFRSSRSSPIAKGRTGRIIGRSWDMMAALVEGPMSAADIETTQRELPKLYAGRATPGTLIWCRSNRIVARLQPYAGPLAAGPPARRRRRRQGLLPDAQYRPRRQRHLRHAHRSARWRPTIRCGRSLVGADAVRLHDAGVRSAT